MINSLSHSLQRKAVSALVDMAMSKIGGNREVALLKTVDMAEQFWNGDYPEENFEAVRDEIRNPDSKWMNIVDYLLDEINPNVSKTTVLNLGYEAFLRGTKTIRKNREIHGCNIPGSFSLTQPLPVI